MPEPGHRDRTEAAIALVRFLSPVTELRSNLGKFPWECDVELATLEPADVKRALERYLQGDLTAADLHSWAETIEMREDINYDGSEQVLDFVFELANPDINGEITVDRARIWISAL